MQWRVATFEDKWRDFTGSTSQPALFQPDYEWRAKPSEPRVWWICPLCPERDNKPATCYGQRFGHSHIPTLLVRVREVIE